MGIEDSEFISKVIIIKEPEQTISVIDHIYEIAGGRITLMGMNLGIAYMGAICLEEAHDLIKRCTKPAFSRGNINWGRRLGYSEILLLDDLKPDIFEEKVEVGMLLVGYPEPEFRNIAAKRQVYHGNLDFKLWLSPTIDHIIP